MESPAGATRSLKRPTWVGIFLLITIVVVVVVASRILYQRTVALLTDNLRNTIITISTTQAANINADDIRALNVEDDWKKPEWKRVVNQLHSAKYANDNVVFMYIFRKKIDDPSQMEFIADADSIDPFANEINVPDGVERITVSECPLCVDVNRDGFVEPDGPDKLQWPGQDYPEAVDIPEAFEAYNGPLTSQDLYTDAYGTVLTGYAPIRDSQGNVAAILATDVKADDFLRITTQTLLPFILFIVSLTIIISTLVIVLLLIWKRHAKSLAYLNDQISVANEKLKDLDASKNEFLSFATHQLRSPLTAIKWGLDATMDVLKTRSATAEELKTVEHLRITADDMVSTVNDLLDISKIEQGGLVMKTEIFDAIEFMDQISEEFRITAQKKGLAFAFEPHATIANINADRTKLRQVVVNLIDNAIKYTPAGNIRVTLDADATAKQVTFTVADTGPGIAPEELAKLFVKFIRGAAGKSSQGGSGLGLYLAKKIVELHSGTIAAYSDGLGKGSRFVVVLPMV